LQHTVNTMQLLVNRNAGWHYFVQSILLSLFLAACSEDKTEFALGEDFIESGTSVRLIDTFSVKLSTVLIDSLPSSTVDTLLVGNYRDEIFGRVTASSYFEIGLPEGTDILDDDVFDSLTITLWYTGYSYGDTLSPMTLLVHRLTENIEPTQSGYLYNTSSFKHEPAPLVRYTFEPRPNSKDSVEIKLNDIIGRQLFDLMRTNSDEISEEAEFVKFFNGIYITADTNYNSSIVGFDTESQHLKLVLYTHRIAETLEEIQYEFPVINTEEQFNQIEHNFGNSLLSTYSFLEGAVPSGKMNNKAFTQGGTGLMTKIEFPTLNEFLMFENSHLLRAELIIRPAKMSYNTFELPETIYLYNTDKHNQIGSILYDEEDEVLAPVFELDELFYEETSYTFDLSSFIASEMNDSYFDIEHGLIMTFSYEEYLCSLKRVVFETLDNAAMLKIYYVHY